MFSRLVSAGCVELGGEGRKVGACGFGWKEWAGGFEHSAALRSAEDTRLNWRTVEGELPNERSTPSGCFCCGCWLLTRRAVGVEDEGTRMAVAAEALRCDDWRRGV